MEFFRLIVVIVAMGIAFEVFRTIYTGRRASPAKHDLNRIQDHEAKIADLEERISVLERIVTDRRTNLRRQIDDLD